MQNLSAAFCWAKHQIDLLDRLSVMQVLTFALFLTSKAMTQAADLLINCDHT